MGDAPHPHGEEVSLDVQSAGEQVMLPRIQASSSEIDGLPVNAPAGNQEEALAEIETAGHLSERLSYSIKDETFTEFIGDLRVILARHPDREDICDRHQDTNLSSSQKHPLLAKPRADQQPSRWIQVKLEVKEDNEVTESTTLAIRDDNVDVMGFRNKKGEWYQLGYQRMLPQEYRSKLLDWGNSYKSILAARNAEEAVAILTSANLGKTFATHAVHVLSCYPDEVSTLSPRLALVGLSVIFCDSAKMNPVRDIIADGWKIETGYNALRMCCYIWKYKYMSRALRRWKISNYAEPRPNSQLDAIYLVLNDDEHLDYLSTDATELTAGGRWNFASSKELHPGARLLANRLRYNVKTQDEN